MVAATVAVGLWRDEAGMVTLGFGAMASPGLLKFAFSSKRIQVEVEKAG